MITKRKQNKVQDPIVVLLINMKYLFEIENLFNGKTFYGIRTLPKDELYEDDFYMGDGVALIGYKKQDGTLVYGAYKRYGIENFVKSCILIGDYTDKQMKKFLKCYIRLMKILGKAQYNIPENGLVTNVKLSEAMKLKWEDDNFRNKVIENMKGRAPTSGNRGMKYKLNNNFCLGEKNNSFGKHWWTNGVDNIFSKGCPEGYKKGRKLNINGD